MSTKAEKEAANWTKGSTALNITKSGLTQAIIKILKEWLKNFRPELFDHLPKFLENLLVKNSVVVKYIDGESKPWKITGNCPCGMRLCQEILNELCDKQLNKSKNVVWIPQTEKSKLYTRRNTLPYTTRLYKRCYICQEEDCPFQCNREGYSLFDEELSKEIVNMYWPLANMFMFRGKEKNKFPNTRPEDTDAALIFKLMKNCSLFSISEDDVDNGIYDELLEVRNILMHSADNRLSDDALDECFDRMVKILKAKKFSNNYSEKAIKELEQLKEKLIIMTTLTYDEASIVKQAFDLQRSALTFDRNVKGMLKDKYFLQGLLEANRKNRDNYFSKPWNTGKSEQKDEKPDSQPKGGAATVTGATTGAVIGAIGGPPGAILGAAVGGLFGKLFE